MGGGREFECGYGMSSVEWDGGWNNETSSGDDRRQGYLPVCDPTILGVVEGDDLWQD